MELTNCRLDHGRLLAFTAEGTILKDKTHPGIKAHNRLSKLFVNAFGSGTIKVKCDKKTIYINKSSCNELINGKGAKENRADFLNKTDDEIVLLIQKKFNREIEIENVNSFKNSEIYLNSQEVLNARRNQTEKEDHSTPVFSAATNPHNASSAAELPLHKEPSSVLNLPANRSNEPIPIDMELPENLIPVWHLIPEYIVEALGGKEGFTALPELELKDVQRDYFSIKPEQMSAPIMWGVDPSMRPFIAVRVMRCEEDGTIITTQSFTLFSRYRDDKYFVMKSTDEGMYDPFFSSGGIDKENWENIKRLLQDRAIDKPIRYGRQSPYHFKLDE